MKTSGQCQGTDDQPAIQLETPQLIRFRGVTTVAATADWFSAARTWTEPLRFWPCSVIWIIFYSIDVQEKKQNTNVLGYLKKKKRKNTRAGEKTQL